MGAEPVALYCPGSETHLEMGSSVSLKGGSVHLWLNWASGKTRGGFQLETMVSMTSSFSPWAMRNTWDLEPET